LNLQVVWSCLSYALQGAPPGVPRRLALPNTWDVKKTWTVATVRTYNPPPPLLSLSLLPLECLGSVWPLMPVWISFAIQHKMNFLKACQIYRSLLCELSRIVQDCAIA